MTDLRQSRIADDGTLEFVGPCSWDGEPLYSVQTVQEGLFESDAFKQMRGQTALETDDASPVDALEHKTDEPDNSDEAVAARKTMFRGFGWNVS